MNLIRVEAVEGNIRSNDELGRLHARLEAAGGVEKVAMNRRDATKNRQRVTSDKGRDVIIDVPRGTTIGHGDVLSHGAESILVVEWMSEETLVLTIERTDDWRDQVERAAKLGYLLGMKHFHPFLYGSEILVPVEENDREEMFKLFGGMEGISVRFEKRILEKSEKAPAYEHHP